MKRFASTRSENRASQPGAGRAQWSVGSIDEDGIRYGLTTHALIASTIATAPTIVTIQSTAIRRRAREPAGDPVERMVELVLVGSVRRRGGSATRTAARAAASSRRCSARPTPRRRRGRCRPSSGSGGVADAAQLLLLGLLTSRSCTRSRRQAVDPAVVAREQDLRHAPAAELRGPRVVRVLEPAVERGREALDLARPLASSAPGSRRATASTSAIAGISPPERTYGPIEIASVQRWSRMRWSKPSKRAESSVSAGSSRELLDELLVELAPLRA